MKHLLPLLIIVNLMLPTPLFASETAASDANDIRVLIDTSGSMKQNDPRNLRVPALKLLVNLLPAGQRAGLWIFDAKAQSLVPPGIIDESWKTQALKAAEQINSRGLFTDIEAVLRASSQDWTSPATQPDKRHIILLTDGMVDVSKNPSDSKASLERIQTELLPQLQQAGVQIHTIALSSQSDQELMRQLAISTGGWNETADAAERLQRIFVQMFNKTTPHDSVPIKDNQFSVDGNIKEFTVMVLLHPGSKPTRLIAPDHSALTQQQLLMNAKWVHEDGYDLVTVPNPAAGQWKLEADVDPANQVLVVTDLKMVPVPLPSHASPEEKLAISVQFTENGEPIKRDDFLKLLTVKAALGEAEHPQEFTLERSIGQPDLFVHQLADPLKPGKYTLSLLADGKTFQREYNQTFEIIDSPITVTTATVTEGETPHVMITLTPDAQVIDLQNLAIHARLADAQGQSADTEAVRNGDVWQLALNLPQPGERIFVNFAISAKTPDGTDLHVELKPVTVGETASEHAQPHEEGHQAAEPDHPPAQPEPPADSSEVNWTKTLGITIAINLLIGAVAYGVNRMLRKRSAANIDDILNQLNH
jgi:uncharacterized protein (TIGR03503 family)